MRMVRTESPRDRRVSPGSSQGDCPACGSTGVRALPLSEGHGEIRMGCPQCRQVWVIADRRRERRRPGERS
jgi:hypothetical protein